MALEKDERDALEGSIYDAHFAASKYIESGKDIHKKLLEISVSEAIETLEKLKHNLQKKRQIASVNFKNNVYTLSS